MEEKTKVEILSPAGSFEAFRAAVNAGCDAVYLGSTKYGARSYAKNFSLDEIRKAIEIAHVSNVKIYYTANTIYKNNEINDFLYDLEILSRDGIDALIIQDIGLYNTLKRNNIKIELHGSTQMTVHSLNGAKFLEELGFQRVVLSRELGIEEIRFINNNINIETECFVHGALCYCYSGQCYLSSIIGQRSGNRGKCAQPCRLPYEVIGDKKIPNSYILSPKDINTLTIIPELVEAKITSFKIEGRMKNPEYVGLITYLYKKYLDLYLSGKDYKVNEKDLEKAMRIYNRGGFSKGYYHIQNGKDMISINRPNHQGVKIGKITRIGKEIELSLLEEVEKGDCLEILSKTNYSFIVKNKSNNKKINIEINNNTKTININDEVYILKDTSLNKEINNKIINSKRKIIVDGYFYGKIGEKSILKLNHNDVEIKVYGEIVEKAKNNPLTKENIVNQIKKTGDYDIIINNVKCDISDGIFIPISKINELRRNAVEKIINKILIENKKEVDFILEKNNISKGCDNYQGNNRSKDIDINILVRNTEQYNVARDFGVKIIYIELLDFEIDEINTIINNKNILTKTYLALPRITRNNNLELNKYLDSINIKDIDGFLVRTYDQYHYIKEKYRKEINIDYTFNIINNSALEFWNSRSEMAAYSIEANYNELKNLNLYNSEALIYGYIPLMISAQCVKKTIGQCDGEKEYISLKDRKKVEFLVANNCLNCTNTIYNCIPLVLFDKYKELYEVGIRTMRIELLKESSKELENILNLATRIKNYDEIRTIDIKEKFEKQGYTRGHFNRGIE